MPRSPSPKHRWPRPAPPPLPSWHGLLAPVAASSFDELVVNVAIWARDSWWFPIHVADSVMRFEFEFGVGARRWDYNGRMFEVVQRTHRAAVGNHAGFHDLFLPLLEDGRIRGILVAGPFSRSRPTSTDVVGRWRELSGKQARLTDPRFAEYLSATLSTLTLEGTTYSHFERMLTAFVGLVQDQRRPEGLIAEFRTHMSALHELGLAERMARATRNLVADHVSGNWASSGEAELHDMGMAGLPQHALAGLFRARPSESDPIGERIRRNACQLACAELADRIGGVASGPIGEHGVAFLMEHDGPRSATRGALADLATRAAALARRFDLELCVGSAQCPEQPVALPNTYRAALWAAERALAQGVFMQRAEVQPQTSGAVLRALRAELAASVSQDPKLLVPRFDRYAEAVLTHAGYRLEFVRAPLEAGVERLCVPLLASGRLDQKSHEELFSAIEQGSERITNARDLVAHYRHLIFGVEHALADATRARQDRATQRGAAFLREHFAEPIGVNDAARAAGFAHDHFTRLFKRDEGVTPEAYLAELRIEHAKRLLRESDLGVESVRLLCGFGTRTYFHRAFKRAVGTTPLGFRRRRRTSGRQRRAATS